MGRILALLILIAAGFYVGWPAFSAYQLQSALTGGDEETVARKIDFASVRASLKPAAEQQVRQELQRMASGSVQGAEALIGPAVPQVTDQVLATLVTPQNAVRLAQGTGALAERVEAMVREQVAGAGSVVGGLMEQLRGQSGAGQRRQSGLVGALSGFTSGTSADRVRDGVTRMLGSDAPGATSAPARTATETATEQGDGTDYGFANIKSFEVTGPLSFAIGVAQDPAAAEPDVTAEMGFRDFDWKLIGIRPRI